MDVYGKIRDKIREIAGVNGESPIIFSAEVIEVSGNVCTVKIDDLELTDVRLKSVVDNESEQLLIIPAVGSMVLLADLSNGEYRDLAVIKYSKVSAISAKVVDGIEINMAKDILIKVPNDLEVSMTKGKLNIKNGGYNLRKAFDDILDAIGRLTVTTGVGPSGTPINFTEFETVKTKLDTFLVE